MGYHVFQRDYAFRISARQHPRALAALRALQTRAPISDRSGEHVSFVAARWEERAASLPDALAEWRWEAEVDAAGDVVAIHFLAGKPGDEDSLFCALAPYVADGSYVEMIAEDGAAWRWLFARGGVHPLAGSLSFEPPAEENRLRCDGGLARVRFHGSGT